MQKVEVGGLKGAVNFIPQRPYAFGDPAPSVNEHIALRAPAQVASVYGRKILYQRYYRFHSAQIPGYDENSTDPQTTIDEFVRSLEATVRNYPKKFEQLMMIEPDEVSVIVHGELDRSYSDEDSVKVIHLRAGERRDIKHNLVLKLLK